MTKLTVRSTFLLPTAGMHINHRELTVTGDHFYTISTAERDVAVREHGYENEGTACHVFGTSILGSVPLHRLYNSRNGDHFYTISDGERDDAVRYNRYRKEGEACYVFPTEQSASLPLYRLFKSSNGDHFYTTDVQERDLAVSSPNATPLNQTSKPNNKNTKNSKPI